MVTTTLAADYRRFTRARLLLLGALALALGLSFVADVATGPSPFPARDLLRGLFDPAAVERLLSDHASGREKHGFRLWALLCLELWFQEVVEARPSTGSA